MALTDFATFIDKFNQQKNFCFVKLNHGFWERLAPIVHKFGENIKPEHLFQADQMFGKGSTRFQSGLAAELFALLEYEASIDDSNFHIGLGLSAWPNDNAIIGTPFYPHISEPVFLKFKNKFKRVSDGTILKKAVMSGEIIGFFNIIENYKTLVVGPNFLQNLKTLRQFSDVDFLTIPARLELSERDKVTSKIQNWLIENKSKNTLVLMQAGDLATYWALKLRKNNTRTKWVDGGLALSIAKPQDILNRPWGKVYRKEIVTTYNKIFEENKLPINNRLSGLKSKVIEEDNKSPNLIKKINFIENKGLDFKRLEYFLENSSHQNHWANRGPAWHDLSSAYQKFFKHLKNKKVIPCSSGALALQVIAALHSVKARKPLKWCISDFGFHNSYRGIFSNSIVVDCTQNGIIDLENVKKISHDKFDGILITNPFGLAGNLKPFFEWQQSHNKHIIIDNAAGIDPDILNVPYQSFSLHQTKPYGMGEGGLIVVPECEYEKTLQLLEYSNLKSDEINHWVSNGKLSDLSAAAHLCRLESAPEWLPLYSFQANRIGLLAQELGFKPLLSIQKATMSYPAIAPFPIAEDTLENEVIQLKKYYKPIQGLRNSSFIYDHIINIPCHPDVASVEKNVLKKVLKKILEKNKPKNV